MSNLVDNIISILRSGPQSAAAIGRRLGVVASTISRQLNQLGGQVLKAGSGPATQWYLRRTLPLVDALTVLPIYRIDEYGDAHHIGSLHIVYPSDSYVFEYFRVNQPNGRRNSEWIYHHSLPWWLTDMRPHGFLGRSFAKQLRSNGLAVDGDPNRWSEDTVLAVLVRFPQHHIGNLLVGTVAYENWLNAAPEASLTEAQAVQRAEAIANGEHFDSSAQGEQPKFVARIAEQDCLVKFSGQVSNREHDSVANRWADLLQTEAIAARVLNQWRPSFAAENYAFCQQNRTLLASLRFDRTSTGGRLGIISWTSLDLEFVGRAQEPWPVIADQLFQQRVITEQAQTAAKLAWAFGQLIANTDMHLGNISCLNRGGRPYDLAPIYDMLPMAFAPKSNGDLPCGVVPIVTHPSVPDIIWQSVIPLAHRFWNKVLASARISHHFKALAAAQLQALEQFNR